MMYEKKHIYSCMLYLHVQYLPPSKLFTFLNNDAWFEGVPSLGIDLYLWREYRLTKGPGTKPSRDKHLE